MQRMYRGVLGPYNAICSVLEDVGDPSVDMPYVDVQLPLDKLLEECKNEYADAKSTRAKEPVLQRYRDYLQLIVAEQKTQKDAVAASMQPMPVPGSMGAPPLPNGQAPPLPMGTSALPPPMPQGLA